MPRDGNSKGIIGTYCVLHTYVAVVGSSGQLESAERKRW